MSFLTTIVHAADKPAAQQGFTIFGLDPLTVGLVLLLVIMVIFMVRNSRKRKRDAEELRNKFVPGAEVMTQHGIYGTLISVDDEKNEAIIETTPGTRLRVHRQTIARVVEPQDADPSQEAVDDDAVDAAPLGEPEYGERLSETDGAEAEAADGKPAPKPRASRTKPANDE
jgi:preprotein translocase subunit YajC